MQQDFAYIERYYGLKFFKGQVVRALGKPGVVMGTESAHVMVRLGSLKFARPYHPTDVEPVEEAAEAEKKVG